MSEELKELLLFQIGPVQEFIAQAENVSELWAGSYLLAKLTLAGIKVVLDNNNNLVFPNFQKDKDGNSIVFDALEEKEIPTIPNRFLATVKKGTAEDIANKAKEAIVSYLTNELKNVLWQEKEAREHAEAFLQITWAYIDYDGSKGMGENYAKVGRKLALRRNVRDFAPWFENELGKAKDFLSGKENVIKNNRGALNNLKLKLVKNKKDKLVENKKDNYNIDLNGEQENGKSMNDDPYIAVIAMDGDKMGASLSNLKEEEDHRAFSKSLAEFAIGVQSIVEKYQGKLIFAGGDDVLAVVSAKKAVECAEELANAFKETMKEYKWKDEKENKEKEISASAGIAIGHKNVPLQDIVHAAHKAESRAKTTYDRGALAITVLKRSGEIIEWGCKWESKTLKLFKEINGSVEDKTHGFAYKLDAYLKPLALDKKPTIEKEYLKAIVKTEFKRLCDRTDVKVEDPEQLKKIASESIDEVFSEGKYRPQDFVNTFLCEAFINRPREEK